MKSIAAALTIALTNGLEIELETTTEQPVPRAGDTNPQRKKRLDGATIKSVRTKHKLYRRWLKSKNEQDFQAYNESRKQATKACRDAKKSSKKQ